MKKKTVFFIFTLLITAEILSHAQYNPESEFRAEPINGGRGVMITEYIGIARNVNIPPRIQNIPVTEIGFRAFRNKLLISVTIPNSVHTIQGSAFENCTSLTSITIPNSVRFIGGSAFSGCTALTNITIPNGVTFIGDGAFSGCSGLTSITIPSSVTDIGIIAFEKCTSLISITFQGSTNLSSSSFGYFFNAGYLGDLFGEYLTGGIGTYTRPNGRSTTWTKS